MKLINWECLEEMDKLIEQWVVVDSIITDIPYWTTACKWDTVIPFDKMWERLNKLIKPNWAIVLFWSEPFSSALRMSNIKNYKYDWVWEKTMSWWFVHAKNKPLKKHENLLVFSNWTTVHKSQSKRRMPYFPQMSEWKPFKRIMKSWTWWTILHSNSKVNEDYIWKELINTWTRYPTSVIKFSNWNNKNVHPTQKPVALMEYLIKTYTHEWETVLDFTMWSGSTGVWAKNTNRKFIGIEKELNIFNWAKERLT